MIRIEKNKFIFVMASILEMLTLMLLYLYDQEMSYKSMAITGIAQWIINVILLKLCSGLELFSIPNIFAFFSMIFHCGQIIKSGFDIPGTSPLPFENYAGFKEIYAAFMFYCFSQVFYCVAVCLKLDINQDSVKQKTVWSTLDRKTVYTFGKALVWIGMIPRLYIDITSLLGALSGGYKGVYTIYYPQVLQSMAFFFDAGLIFLIYSIESTKNKRFLFLATIVYKCLMMSTGARQDKVAFLLIWLYAYYFVINKISFRSMLLLSAAGIGGFFLISAIGTLRVSDSISIFDIADYLKQGDANNIVGNSLGEFGGSLNTLEVAIKYAPSKIKYGYGKTYIAGFFSVIPLLVNQFPGLAKTAYFLEQLPRSITFAFGGSYLGEIYYNFSWFGILVSSIIGVVIGNIHNKIIRTSDTNGFDQCWYTVLSTALVLYVRGYFGDMIQKLVWTYLVLIIIRQFLNDNKARVNLGVE